MNISRLKLLFEPHQKDELTVLTAAVMCVKRYAKLNACKYQSVDAHRLISRDGPRIELDEIWDEVTRTEPTFSVGRLFLAIQALHKADLLDCYDISNIELTKGMFKAVATAWIDSWDLTKFYVSHDGKTVTRDYHNKPFPYQAIMATDATHALQKLNHRRDVDKRRLAKIMIP